MTSARQRPDCLASSSVISLQPWPLTSAERVGNLSFTVFRLTTFGGLGIEADNGATAPRLRPPRLALLAVLAAALAGCSDGAVAPQTVAVDMAPNVSSGGSSQDLRPGDTLRFSITVDPSKNSSYNLGNGHSVYFPMLQPLVFMRGVRTG